MGDQHEEITRKVVAMYNQYPYPTYGNHDHYFQRYIAPCLPEVRPLRRVLEAGCGTGCVTLDMARSLPEVEIIAFDLADASLAYARELARAYSAHNVSIEKRDFLAPNDDLRDFDFVLSMGVIHHLSDPAAGVRQVHRFLRPGGYAYIYLYATLGRRRLRDMREFLSVIGADRLSENRRALVAMDVQSVMSYGPIINTLLEHRRGYATDGLLQLAARKAVRRFQGAKGRLGPSPTAKPELIAIHDVILHPHDTDYRFVEMHRLIIDHGLLFVKVAQGMPDSIAALSLPSDIAELASRLPKVKQYQLIELLTEPRGIGFLVQKPPLL